jgi:hypothetical protein
MKKIIGFAACCFISFASFAQTVNDKPIAEIDVEYIQIVGTNRLLSNKMNIELDFGQVNKLFIARDAQVKDASGKVVIFNSMMDALNFMSEAGYEFVNAHTTNLNNLITYYYILRRKNK